VRVVRLRRIALKCPNGPVVDVEASPEDGIWIDGDVLVIGSEGDAVEYFCSPQA